MSRFLLGSLVGVLVGGAVAFYLFVGIRDAAPPTGMPVASPDPSSMDAGSAEIVLRPEIFNDVLSTIFSDIRPPTFPLGPGPEKDAGRNCGSDLTIVREGSGTRTAVSFDNNKLSAAIPFSGSYGSDFGCFQFTGWAQANLELRYDAARKAVFGQINVETVNLDGVNPLIGGLITPIVQSTFNSRVNPILLIDGQQIAISLPVAASNGTLNAAVKDVRGEVKENRLHLYITYDFQGTPLQPGQ